MSDLTAHEVAVAAAELLAEGLPGVHYVEAIGHVPHRVEYVATSYDGTEVIFRLRQDSTGPDESPQTFSLRVQAEEVTPVGHRSHTRETSA